MPSASLLQGHRWWQFEQLSHPSLVIVSSLPAAQQGSKIPVLTLLLWANPSTNCIRSGPDKTWKVFKEGGLDRGQVGQSWTAMHSLQSPQLISQEVRRGQLFKTGPPEAVSLGLHTSALTSHWEWAALGEGRRCGFGGGGCLQLRAVLERLRSWGAKAAEWLGERVPGPGSGGSGVGEGQGLLGGCNLEKHTTVSTAVIVSCICFYVTFILCINSLLLHKLPPNLKQQTLSFHRLLVMNLSSA